jgi:hypothetical protein
VRATSKEQAGKTISFNLWLEQLRFVRFPATDAQRSRRPRGTGQSKIYVALSTGIIKIWAFGRDDFERMEAAIDHSKTEKAVRRSIWNRAAWMAWSVALVILVLRPLVASHRGTSFDTYQLAGLHWLHGEGIYTQWMGFVYSPLVAAFFAPFAGIPSPIANIVWRLLNSAALLAGMAALLKTEIFSAIKGRYSGILYLLLMPLAIGNIDISQANPLVAGMIMLSVAAAYRDRWNIAALCVGVATSLKIYPIAVGLLICVVAPRRFTWRILIALLLVGLVPFLFQHWSYVSEQYSAWIATRASDNRQQWPIEKLPLDLWFLIHWVAKLPVPPRIYSVIQLGTAASLALLCAVKARQGWARGRIMVALFNLVSIWMTLCGPATESYTYMMLAPAIVLSLVQALASHQPGSLRTLAIMAFALQFAAAARASFLPHFKPFWALSVQPVSGLVLLAYTLVWLFNEALWPRDNHEILAPRAAGSAV